MGDLGPGDYVECIKSETDASWGLFDCVAGQLYRVSSVVANDWPCEDCGDDVSGIVFEGEAPVEDACHCACGFRPIYRPRADLIENLLAPAPELEPA